MGSGCPRERNQGEVAILGRGDNGNWPSWGRETLGTAERHDRKGNLEGEILMPGSH